MRVEDSQRVWRTHPHPQAVFFRCYKCTEWTMSITVFGVYCQGCGLRSFTEANEIRIAGACSSGHSELAQSRHGTRCLVCSVMGGSN